MLDAVGNTSSPRMEKPSPRSRSKTETAATPSKSSILWRDRFSKRSHRLL